MKVTLWKRIVRPLLPEGERWEFHRDLCYRAPVGRILFGLLAEGSAFDKGNYIWCVRTPLFVPSEGGIGLSYSYRVGGGSNKIPAEHVEELNAAIVHCLNENFDEEAALARLTVDGADTLNTRVTEVAAYAHILLGDLAAAGRLLARAAAADIDRTSWWQVAIVERVLAVQQLLAEHGQDAVIAHLDRQAKASAGSFAFFLESSVNQSQYIGLKELARGSKKM